MRVAIVSDIHGNVRGLEACLADLRAQGGADLVIGAGDYCMDGPRPREVLECLKEAGATCVRGNTDRYIAEPLRTEEGCAIAPDKPGHGIVFDWAGLERVKA